MAFSLVVRKQLIGEPYTLPVGSIIAWHPRLFSSTGNTGISPVDAINLSGSWTICDGKNLPGYGITDSPLVSGAYQHIPDLTDDRFLLGGQSNTTYFLGDSFSYGGANHAGPPVTNSNNGDNTITIESTNLPLHTHGVGTINVPSVLSSIESVSHTHSYFYDGFGGIGTSAGGGTPMELVPPYYDSPTTLDETVMHTHSVAVPTSSFSGETDNGAFAQNSISIMPKYLSTKYIMRIK